MASKHKRLGDLLLSVGVITDEDLNRALEIQKETKKRLGQVLVEYKFISESQLVNILQMQLGVEFIDLSKSPIDPAMAAVVPKNIAKKYAAVPVKISRGEVWVAMSDPLNFFAIEEIRNVSRRKVVPMIAMAEAVDRAIITLYGNEGAAKAIEEMRRSGGLSSEENAGGDNAASVNLTDDVEAAPTIRLVNSIIERAITERASDIHLEPRENEMAVRMRVDGVLRNILQVPRGMQASVISRLKVMSNMNISERKSPQDGRANVRIKNHDIDLRVSTLPTVYGEKMVIRLLDKSAQQFDKDGIGLTGELQIQFDKLLRSTSGVILISGPTGSGKSSTMLTMVKILNTEGVNLITLEDPVEYNIDGVNQCQINEKVGMTFAGGLRSILRQDPDIISIGEIRDGETASIAMRAAITGHLVLSTIHTSDAPSSIDRLIDIGVEPYLISSALKGVIGQRLVRKICPTCKEEYEPTREELDIINIPYKTGMKLYRGKGCPTCFHTGYRGRTAVFEILTVDHNLRRLIVEKKNREEIIECAVKSGFSTLANNCRQMVIDGITTSVEAAKAINSTIE